MDAKAEAAATGELKDKEAERDASRDSGSDELEAAKTDVAPKLDAAPPDGGYGWVVAGCLFALNACTWGVNTSFGVILAIYNREALFPGVSQFQYAFIGGLSIAMAFATAPFSNYLSKRLHFKIPMFAGALCVVLSQVFAGLSPAFYALLLSQGVLFGLGLGLIVRGWPRRANTPQFTPSLPLLAGWFSSKRALANGIAGAGSGGGALLFSLVTRAMVDRTSTKVALIVNGGITAVLLVPAIALLRSRAKHVEARFESWDLKLFSHPGFVCATLWLSLASAGYIAVIYTLVSYATVGLGLSSQQGAIVQACLAVGQLLGRPPCGWVLDRLGRLNLSIVASLLTAIFTLAWWLPARSFSVLCAYAAFTGATSGVFWTVRCRPKVV